MALFAAAQVQGPDFVMLVGYFAIMVGIGFYFYRHMSDMKTYFSGGNQIPWWLSGISFYMTSFSAFAFVSYSGLAYKFGMVAVTLFWVTVPATLFSVYVFATRWRRARIDSPVEYLETRYSHTFRQICTWQGLPVTLIDDALKMIATGSIVSVGMGMGMKESIFWSGVVMLAYTFMGGLWAVVITDFVQFVVLSAAVVILVPLSLAKVDGLAGLLERAPDGFFSLTTPEYNWFFIFMTILLYCVAWSSTRWALIQKYYCVPAERDTLKLGWLVAILNIVVPPLMFLPAMAAQQFLPGIETIEVYSRVCAALLPAGMLGLVIAAMFAATMSTLSGDFNVCAGVLTNDVYRRLIRPRASERELVLVGRVSTLLVGFLSIGIAIWLAGGSAEKLFRNMLTLFSIAAAPLGVPMLVGLLSRRATNVGAILGSLGGIVIGLLLFFLMPEKGADFLGAHWAPEMAIFAATTLMTLITMLVVSLAFPMSAADAERADRFYQRLMTPIGQTPEDQALLSSPKAAFSPFRVVGICILAIGLLMLAVQPWVGGTAGTLNVAFAAGFIVMGGMITWATRARPARGDIAA
ncbi:MAG: sodium transporter [Rhodopirellula sp.]|nr:sodium transporter [Rhodopirellula sp.]